MGGFFWHQVLGYCGGILESRWRVVEEEGYFYGLGEDVLVVEHVRVVGSDHRVVGQLEEDGSQEVGGNFVGLDLGDHLVDGNLHVQENFFEEQVV